MSRELEDLYEKALVSVKSIVHAADPEGLVDFAPDDEYDTLVAGRWSLVAGLARRLLQGEPMTAAHLFSSWTGWSGKISQHELADQLAALQQETRTAQADPIQGSPHASSTELQ